MISTLRHPQRRSVPTFNYLIIALTTAFLISCATVQRPKVMDRSQTPDVKTDVPADLSEIREITFQAIREEKGHQDLHLVGQLFKKAEVNGSSRMSPCAGCIVSFSNPADSSVKATMVTENDGYFDFDGKLLFNTITVTAPDHNKIEISNVNFEHGGITTMKLILASGSNTDRFVLRKDAKLVHWSRL